MFFKRFFCILFGIVVGAGLGNLVDRFFYGGVVDYLNLFDFVVFNISDLALFSCFIIVIFFIFGSKKRDKKS